MHPRPKLTFPPRRFNATVPAHQAVPGMAGILGMTRHNFMSQPGSFGSFPRLLPAHAPLQLACMYRVRPLIVFSRALYTTYHLRE